MKSCNLEVLWINYYHFMKILVQIIFYSASTFAPIAAILAAGVIGYDDSYSYYLDVELLQHALYIIGVETGCPCVGRKPPQY